MRAEQFAWYQWADLVIRHLLILCAVALTACTQTPISREDAADRCEERARNAQAPYVDLTVGLNSDSGSSASAGIGFSTDLLRGTDPLALYDSCVVNLTGELPIRPARLRAL